MFTKIYGFISGLTIGILGGLIGLGGAEFRLPILIGLFKFQPLSAAILNKTISLVVVSSALIFRTDTIPFSLISEYKMVILTSS
ncbi:MAG: hypothetical protein LBQ18_01545 [Campylobacteraceae bacterium]|jgi:uncharacterized membrane protein YfcA|nr:hypothetical protein [Campylobacteraceae bacterium]